MKTITAGYTENLTDPGYTENLTDPFEVLPMGRRFRLWLCRGVLGSWPFGLG